MYVGYSHYLLPIAWFGVLGIRFSTSFQIIPRIVGPLVRVSVCFKNVFLFRNVYAVPCARKIIFCPACPVVF